jgi:hypothetical protein
MKEKDESPRSQHSLHVDPSRIAPNDPGLGHEGLETLSGLAPMCKVCVLYERSPFQNGMADESSEAIFLHACSVATPSYARQVAPRILRLVVNSIPMSLRRPTRMQPPRESVRLRTHCLWSLRAEYKICWIKETSV